MSADCDPDVIAFIEELKPKRLLCVAPDEASCAGAVRSGRPLVHWDPAHALAAEAVAERFELAFVAGALEALGVDRGGALLARLRDLYAHRVLVRLHLARAAEAGWSGNGLLAYGFTRGGHCREGDDEFGLYLFDLDTYKVTPDWFGPHDWANPERWDQDWW